MDIQVIFINIKNMVSNIMAVLSHHETLNQYNNSKQHIKRIDDAKKRNIQAKIAQKERDAYNQLVQLQQNLPGSAENLQKLYDRCYSVDENVSQQVINELRGQLPDARIDWCDSQLLSVLLPFAQVMYGLEKNGIAEENAYKLSVMFDSVSSVLQYFDSFVKQKLLSDQPMHDACQFALPSQDVDWDVWRKFCQKNYQYKVFWDLLPNARMIEDKIKEKVQSRSSQPDVNTLKQQRQKIQNLRSKYNNIRRHRAEVVDDEQIQALNQLNDAQKQLTEFAPAFDEQLTLEDLRAFKEICLEATSPVYRYFLDKGLTYNDYVRFCELDRYDDNTQMPKVSVQGTEIDDDYQRYYLRKLDVENDNDAAIAAVLGKLTQCCQSLSKEAGDPCARHGLTSKYGGFYVLFKGDPDKPSGGDQVVAQTWAWRSQSGAIVFDSIEPPFKSRQQKRLIEAFYRSLATKLVQEGHTHKVAGGRLRNRYELCVESPTNKIEQFRVGDDPGYNDSKDQVVFYERDKPYYWYVFDKENKATDQLLTSIFENKSTPLAHSETLNDMLLYCSYWPLRPEDMARMFDSEEVETLNATINKRARQSGRDRELTELRKNIDNYTAGKIPLVKALDLIRQNKLPVNVAKIKKRQEILGDTPLMELMRYRNVNQLVEQTNRPLTYEDSVDKEDLRTDIALMLLDKGADIDAQDFNGNTPLMVALASGAVKTAGKLIEKGAKLTVKNKNGLTPIIIAAEQGHLEHVEQILAKITDNNADISRQLREALRKSADRGRINVVDKLLQKGAPPDVQALTIAAEKDNINIVKRLIKAGVDINGLGHLEKTAFATACSENNIDVVHTLIKSGASVNSDHLGKNQDKVLTRAANEGRLEIVNTFGRGIMSNSGFSGLEQRFRMAKQLRGYIEQAKNEKSSFDSAFQQGSASNIDDILKIMNIVDKVVEQAMSQGKNDWASQLIEQQSKSLYECIETFSQQRTVLSDSQKQAVTNSLDSLQEETQRISTQLYNHRHSFGQALPYGDNDWYNELIRFYKGRKEIDKNQTVTSIIKHQLEQDYPTARALLQAMPMEAINKLDEFYDNIVKEDQAIMEDEELSKLVKYAQMVSDAFQLDASLNTIVNAMTELRQNVIEFSHELTKRQQDPKCHQQPAQHLLTLKHNLEQFLQHCNVDDFFTDFDKHERQSEYEGGCQDKENGPASALITAFKHYVHHQLTLDVFDNSPAQNSRGYVESDSDPLVTMIKSLKTQANKLLAECTVNETWANNRYSFHADDGSVAKSPHYQNTRCK